MKNFKNTLPLLVSGLLCGQLLTACGEFDAFTPEALKQTQGQGEKTELPENISNELADALIQTVNANPNLVFGDSSKDDERTVEKYFSTFDSAGDGKIRGVTVTKTPSEKPGIFDINVKIMARAAEVNRELEYAGSISGALNGASSGFLGIDAQSAGENLSAYVTCLGLQAKGANDFTASDAFDVAALVSNEAFEIFVLAACVDESCSKVLVQLELNNRGQVLINSRIALLAADDGSADSNELSIVDSSLSTVVSFAEAELNKKEEVILPECQSSLSQVVSASPVLDEGISATVPSPEAVLQVEAEEAQTSQDVAPAQEIDGGSVVEEVDETSTNVSSAVAEQDELMRQAVEEAVRQANEGDDRRQAIEEHRQGLED